MTQLFGISIDTLTSILLTISLVLVGIVVLLALCNAIFFKIGTRNIPRRRMQMVLIVFALMLSTTLLSSVLATGDVITATVQSVAVYNLGNVDELIEGGRGAIGIYPDRVYYGLLQREKGNPDIAAIGAALREQNLLVADQTSRQVRSKVPPVSWRANSSGGVRNRKLSLGDAHTWTIRFPSSRGPRYSRSTSSSGSSGIAPQASGAAFISLRGRLVLDKTGRRI